MYHLVRFKPVNTMAGAVGGRSSGFNNPEARGFCGRGRVVFCAPKGWGNWHFTMKNQQ
jgi:hypothetical protein